MSNMISLFPNFSTTDSLFQKMVAMGAPWTDEIGKTMDIAYFTMHSGMKSPSFFTVQYSNPMTEQNAQAIAQILWDLYGKNWEHLWTAYASEYNPIDNYNVTETVNRDQTNNRVIDKAGTFSSTVDGTGTQTNSSQGTSSLQHGHGIATNDEINDFDYGFNSSQHVPVADQLRSGTVTNSGTDTTTDSSSSTQDLVSKDVRADSTAENTKDDDTINENISRVKKGNVGQNSYQELLRQEFELWKWNFYFQVFSDVDKFLCLSVFDPCSSVN